MHVKHKATYIIYSPQSDIPIKYIRPPSTIPTRLNGLQKYLQQEFRFTRTWGKILFNSRTCLGKMSTYENRCKCQVKSRSFILQKIISLIKNCIIIFLQNLLWFLHSEYLVYNTMVTLTPLKKNYAAYSCDLVIEKSGCTQLYVKLECW